MFFECISLSIDPEQRSDEGRRMRASMSRKGNCYDNAPIESFWGTLKTELVHHRRYRTRAEAAREIAEYIDLFYNRQ
jgi:transposase InsO family protein